MKLKHLLPLLMVTITSCTQNTFAINRKVFCFDTMVDAYLFEGADTNLVDIEDICYAYSDLSDNYHLISDINNVYSINQTNDEVTVDSKLYQLLQKSFDVKSTASNFNPLLGSLSKKWKEAIENDTTLSSEVITQELEKLNNTTLAFLSNNTVKRNGDAELDLGGIAKGYTLDVIKEYFVEKEITHYLINAGNSSILLGEKSTNDGYFIVGLNDLKNAYLQLKNCVISTSGNSTQGKHIVNPTTGQLADLYDAVIVVSEGGANGDALSTSLMMNTVEEIQEIEVAQNIKVIVIKNNAIVYKNAELGVLYH